MARPRPPRAGSTSATASPLGATTRSRSLVAAAAEGRVTGRIHGEVTRLVGSGDGARVVVDDGSLPLDVWCPAGTSPWPVHRTRFEFEVTIDSPVGAPPDLDSPHEQATRHALAGDLETAQAAVLELAGELDRHRAAAVVATSGRSTESPDKAPHVAWRACRGGLPSTRSTPRTRSRSRATRSRSSQSPGTS